VEEEEEEEEDQIEHNEMGGAGSTYGREVHIGFWRGNLRKRDHLGDPSVKWEDNIKKDLQEVGWGCVDQINMTQVAGSCKRGNEPSGSIICGEFLY
jgi:hypothetical protein